MRALVTLCEELRLVRPRIATQEELTEATGFTKGNLSDVITAARDMRLCVFERSKDGPGWEFEVFLPRPGFWRTDKGDIPWRIKPEAWARTRSRVAEMNSLGQLRLPLLMVVAARQPGESSARQNLDVKQQTGGSVKQNPESVQPSLFAQSSDSGDGKFCQAEPIAPLDQKKKEEGKFCETEPEAKSVESAIRKARCFIESRGSREFREHEDTWRELCVQYPHLIDPAIVRTRAYEKAHKVNNPGALLKRNLLYFAGLPKVVKKPKAKLDRSPILDEQRERASQIDPATLARLMEDMKRVAEVKRVSA